MERCPKTPPPTSAGSGTFSTGSRSSRTICWTRNVSKSLPRPPTRRGVQLRRQLGPRGVWDRGLHTAGTDARRAQGRRGFCKARPSRPGRRGGNTSCSGTRSADLFRTGCPAAGAPLQKQQQHLSQRQLPHQPGQSRSPIRGLCPLSPAPAAGLCSTLTRPSRSRICALSARSRTPPAACWRCSTRLSGRR